MALFGFLIIFAWHAHWVALLQISPGFASAKYDTALNFVLCGLGAALLTTRFSRLAVVLGGVVSVIAALTLCEYLTVSPFDIDQLFIRDYLRSANDFPGRMSQLTAGCFTLAGAALILAGVTVHAERIAIVAALACVVGIIAIVALFGYVFGIEEAYGWGAYTRMAAHTAGAFLVLSFTVLEWTRQAAQRQAFDLRGWLPIMGSVTLMAMIAFVSSVGMAHLKNSDDWRSHTYDVLLAAQTLLGEIGDMQRGAHGYVLTGQFEALEPYRSGIKNSPLQLAKLRLFTRDNLSQIPRLDALATDISAVADYARRIIELRESAGIKAAVRLESTHEGRILSNRTRSDMHAFTAAERLLLVERTERADANLTNSARLLVLASGLAAALLVWAHIRSNSQIHRRRHAERALQKVSALQRAILDAANYAIISRSLDNIVTTYNSTAERWLGYPAAEVIGKSAPEAWYDKGEVIARAKVLSLELGHPVDGFFETFVAKARLGQRDENEWTMFRKDGSQFPIWRSVTAQRDAAGNVVGFVSVITDITERKEHEAEISLGEERFRRAFDDAPIGMALVNPSGKWLKVNQALCKLLGYTSSELLKKDVQSVTHRDERAASEEFIRAAIAGKEPPYHMEKRYVRQDGSIVFARLNISLVREVGGKPLYFITQIEDITESREVDRMKGEFVSTVSHELRTPLTSIRGALGLIDAGVLGPLPEMAESMVKIAHQNSERLVRIINDILDVEKISSGKLELRIEDLPMGPFLEQALDVNEPYGAKHGISFALEAVPSGLSVLADSDRLMQVMANLLSNAAKFSPSGTRVVVRASAQGERVRVEVEDHGTGIPEAFRSRVFEKFAQADSSSSRHFEGTGLGLSITRDLINAMDGTIGFKTVSGYGTTFHFQLPRAHAAHQRSPGAPRAVSAGHKVLSYRENPQSFHERTGAPRVLYVEDDIDITNIIDAALAGKADIVSAGSLQEAESRLREEQFSLVVLDLGLPDGNGLSLLEQLPVLTNHSTPVVILSATEVSQQVRQRVAAALVKSRVSETHIVKTILSLLPEFATTSVERGLEECAVTSDVAKSP